MEQYLPLYIIGGVILIALIWMMVTYNLLVSLRQHCRESWSDVDTELKRRYDLIPNLVETVKGYATHEKDTFQAVIEARNNAQQFKGDVRGQAAEEAKLVGGLKKLFALAEGYPNLKASGNFLQLQTELSNTEDRIQAARRFYNANVRDMNTRVEMFPSNLIAGMFNFKKEEFFEVEDSAVREVPKVDVG